MEATSLRSIEYKELRRVAFTYPAIDNHAHSLLRAENRNELSFNGVISEAQGDGLANDAIHTLACYRATHQLAELFGLPGNASWEDVKAKRSEMDYLDLCKLSLEPTGIQCILIDDGVNPRSSLYEIPWHDQFTSSPSRRIVRIEVIAEEILEEQFKDFLDLEPSKPPDYKELLGMFVETLDKILIDHASNPHVVGFKSVICYRTGLDVSARQPSMSHPDLISILASLFEQYRDEKTIRISGKVFNDFILHRALEISAKHRKPVQFHTGLGDNDLTLSLASPAHLQPVIKAYPDTIFVLLHSSYPYTRDAGYLTSLYSNVFLDFGEVFPFVSGQGQRSIIRQMLELTPTNKIMWSMHDIADAHFWPESYYLGTIQSRAALHEVLSENVRALEITEAEAITILKNAYFHTANRVYNLGLTPNFEGQASYFVRDTWLRLMRDRSSIVFLPPLTANSGGFLRI